MSESANLGDALIRFDDIGGEKPPTPREIADRAIRRDRRRVRILATLTILFWFLHLLIVPGLLLPLGAKVRNNIDLQRGAIEHDPPVSPQILLGMTWKVVSMVFMLSSVTALLGAAFTVWLVLAVRRLTLRQVSANLEQIAGELRRLRPT